MPKGVVFDRNTVTPVCSGHGGHCIMSKVRLEVIEINLYDIGLSRSLDRIISHRGQQKDNKIKQLVQKK